MFKILFYHANDLDVHHLAGKVLHLSIASLYLKTYLEINDPKLGSKLTWLAPIQLKLTDEELINICLQQQPDLICLGQYIWNQNFYKEQFLRIKNKLPKNCKIVVGGPSVDVNTNPDFFLEHNYAEYAIYGPGEIAFYDLIYHLYNNKKLLQFNVSNLAWYDNNKKKQIVSAYKYVPQSQISPYLYNEKYFSNLVLNETNKGINVFVPYELTRGCPYSCTFCDWNSGLSNKVSRRKNSYKDELNLFHRLKIKDIYIADANFGQYEEDIEIAKYIAYKNVNENAQFRIEGNVSKLRKENNLKIYHILASSNAFIPEWGFTISLQDINLEVLKNINRPDVSWEINKKLTLELSQTYPHIISKIQFIIGLPGQNLTSMIESLNEMTSIPHTRLCAFVSELLPASPAALDKTYQEKFKFVYSNSQRMTRDGIFFRGKFPASCISFDKSEFVSMVLIAAFYSSLTIYREDINYQNLNISQLVENFLSTEYFFNLKHNLYNNWVNNDKFYYTIDFDGSPKNITACDINGVFITWANNEAYKNFIIQTLKYDKPFVKHIYNIKNDKTNRTSIQKSYATVI